MVCFSLLPFAIPCFYSCRACLNCSIIYQWCHYTPVFLYMAQNCFILKEKRKKRILDSTVYKFQMLKHRYIRNKRVWNLSQRWCCWFEHVIKWILSVALLGITGNSDSEQTYFLLFKNCNQLYLQQYIAPWAGWPEQILPNTTHVALNFTVIAQKTLLTLAVLQFTSDDHITYSLFCFACSYGKSSPMLFFSSFSCDLQICFSLDSGSAAVRWRDIYMWFISGRWEISTWFSLFCGD